MLLFYVDMVFLIDKALKDFYVLLESLIVCKHGNILLSFIFKENTLSNFITVLLYYRNTYQQGG